MNGETHEPLINDGPQAPVAAVIVVPGPARLTFRQQLDRWLLGLNRAALQGGAVAVKAFFAAAGASTVPKLGIPSITPSQAAVIFLFGAGYHFFDYLASNPIPDVPVSSEPNSPKPKE